MVRNFGQKNTLTDRFYFWLYWASAMKNIAIATVANWHQN